MKPQGVTPPSTNNMVLKGALLVWTLHRAKVCLRDSSPSHSALGASSSVLHLLNGSEFSSWTQRRTSFTRGVVSNHFRGCAPLQTMPKQHTHTYAADSIFWTDSGPSETPCFARGVNLSDMLVGPKENAFGMIFRHPEWPSSKGHFPKERRSSTSRTLGSPT